MNSIINYNIYYPSGNTTALVIGEFGLRYRDEINKQIMDLNNEVEQVGFVFQREGKYYLEMAGGEFCGNATRSAAYYFLNGKDGEINIKVSGVKRPLLAGVRGNNTYSEVPFLDISNIRNEVQSLEGITHIIQILNHRISKKDLLELAESVIHNYLSTTKVTPNALGVMFILKNDDGYELFPVVKVFSIQTTFYETACGSGSACVGLFLHSEYQMDIDNIIIRQPSGDDITVNIKFDNQKPVRGFIEGEQKCISIGNLLDISEFNQI